MTLSRHIQGMEEQLYLLRRFSAEYRQKTFVLLEGRSLCLYIFILRQANNLVLAEIVDKATQRGVQFFQQEHVMFANPRRTLIIRFTTLNVNIQIIREACL